MILIKNANIFAPEAIGVADVLIEGGRIAAVQKNIDIPAGAPNLRVLDAEGRCLVPGFIDLHTHIIGGGGEDGFSSRSPEAKLTDFTLAGVTTAVGLLGTDGVSRCLDALFAKACAMSEEGISCFMLTGAYAYPSPTLCGSVERDLVLIDRVIGAKIALSDHRSSEITYEELLRLASSVHRGAMLGRKAGVLTIHMGDGKEKLSKLFRAAAESSVPIKTFLPTHVERNADLLEEAIRWLKLGGLCDFTAGAAGQGGTARSVMRALDAGAEAENITLSSDAFGSQPSFDERGCCVGLCYSTSSVLLDELKNLVNMGVSLEKGLPFMTRNPARILRMEKTKGCIAPGADADLVLLRPDDLSIDTVFARGREMVSGGTAIVKGRFER